ncbi:hypothetical protein BSKO_12458 [Bryopsis sp. KO-2023]|nr:hypothetical protein BSKO_12458 [Bryopsis sp. KO-2023]
MILDPINEVIEGFRLHWVDCVTALAYQVRRLVRCGVPVFVLDPDKSEGIEHRKSSGSKPTASRKEIVSKITFYENKNAITCCSFSADGSRIASGHDNGSLVVWSADHGTMLHEHKKIHKLSPVADIAFYADSTTMVLSCDFHGNVAMWDTNTRVVYGDCSVNWKHEEMLGPKVRWPVFCRDGTSLMYPVTYFTDMGGDSQGNPSDDETHPNNLAEDESLRGAPAGLNFRQGCSLFVLDTSRSGPMRGHQEMLASRVMQVASRNNAPDFAFAWGAFSNSNKGLLVGFNERPSGFITVFPNFEEASDVGYLLEGIVGCWSPMDDYVATWEIETKASSMRQGGCYLWKVRNFNQSSTCLMPEIEGSHLFQAPDPSTLKDPGGGNVYWASFLPDLHGCLGIATCVVKDQLEILLWDVHSQTLLQRLSTDIGRSETRLVDTDAWDNQWVRVQRSYGLGLIASSGNGQWLGVYSADAQKGYIWDARSGIQVLGFSVPAELSKNPNSDTLDMDLHFSWAGDRFLLCSEENMLVWNPRPLGNSAGGLEGISTAVLKSSDKLIDNGQVTCRFSMDGELLGICRSYALVMSVWDLGTGLKYTLLPGATGECSAKEIKALLRAKKAQQTRRILDKDSLYLEHSMNEETAALDDQVSGKDTSSNRYRFCVFGISPHGKRIVTCMGDLSVLLWELEGSAECVVTHSRRIAKLRSKYYPAWGITFSRDPNSQEMVVVCEDTGMLVWIDPHKQVIVSRRQGGGLKRCQFSSDGTRGVLMPSEEEVNVWDLVNRRKIQRLEYKLWMGPSGVVSFPHNISMMGSFAVVGVRSDWRISEQGEGFLTCNPETTEADLKDLARVPANVCMAENSNWVVVDRLVDIRKRGAEHPSLPLLSDGLLETSNGNEVLLKEIPFVNGSASAGGESPPEVANEAVFKVEPYPSIPQQVSTIDEGQEPVPEEIDVKTPPTTASGYDLEAVFTSTSKGETDPKDESDEKKERFPEVGEFYSDDTWQYLLKRTQCQDGATDQLMILDVNGVSEPKILKGRGLQPSKFISISHDGRRVACLGENGGLFVWNVHATEGCLNDWHNLDLAEATTDEKEISRQLDLHGAGLLNYPDHEGLTIPMHAILDRNYELLDWMVSWAMKHRVPMDLIKEKGVEPDSCTEGKITTALDLSVSKRIPECAEIILKHLSKGLTSHPAMMKVYSASLIPLSKVFPSAYRSVLSDDTLFHTLPTIKVPERTFRHREFKVTTSDTMIYTQSGLQRMWMDNLKASHRADSHMLDSATDGAKMISAIPRVVPYPDIVSLDKRGFMKQLSIRYGGSQIYSTTIVKAVIHAHWKIYGRRLLVEELWHFALLWLLFTTYSISLGGLWKLISFNQFLDANAPRRKTNMYAALSLLICWILGVLGLVREFTKVNAFRRESGARGLLRWAKSHWNWIDLASYGLLVGVIAPYHFFVAAGSTEVDEQNSLTVMVSTESILLSWKMLRYAQGFRTTAPVVIMIKEILKAIIVFLILTFGLMIGFAIAFYVLFRVNLNRPCILEKTVLMGRNLTAMEGGNVSVANATDEDIQVRVTTQVKIEQCEESKQEAQSLYGSVGLSMLTAFGMMLGETQLDSLSALDGSLRVIGTIMFVIYLLAIMIVLLNLLIAVMGDSFDRVKNTEENQFLLARSEVMNDMESMMSQKKRRKCRKEMKNLYAGLKANSDMRFEALLNVLRANGMETPQEELTAPVEGNPFADETRRQDTGPIV